MILFQQKIQFNNKLKIKNVTSNKIKDVLVENELNELSEKVQTTSTIVLNDLIKKFSILNGAKYFFQEYFKIIQ